MSRYASQVGSQLRGITQMIRHSDSSGCGGLNLVNAAKSPYDWNGRIAVIT